MQGAWTPGPGLFALPHDMNQQEHMSRDGASGAN